jgi:transcriptional regulator with GAF, ATPase, and Fis domain
VKADHEQLNREIKQREGAEQVLRERLQFERLLSEVSARFVNVPLERVDSEIEKSLRQILDFFKVDRCALIRLLPGKESWQITHLAAAEDMPEVPVGVELSVSTHPWAYHKLIEKREIVSVTNLDDLPPEANVDKQTWIEWGIRSTLSIPILILERVGHAITFNSVRSQMIWQVELFPRLQLLGEIFVNTMERKEIRLEIRERLRFEGLISNLSASFVNLPPDEVDAEINRGLRSITEFFDADRCTMGFFSEDGTLLARGFEYLSPGVESAPESISKEQMPWYMEQMIQGNPVIFSRVEDLPPEAEKERRICLHKKMSSVLCVPMVGRGKTLGTCALVWTRTARVWPKELVQRFRLITEVFVNALERKRMEEQLRENLLEIKGLKQQLERENIYLQEEVTVLADHGEIVGQSSAMKKILAQAEQVAPTDSTVLILGETGTGKELLARAIHRMSSRKDRPLITVNCSSLPPTLIESELFGRERGAYTGALTKMVGRFELADGSTLFLDEIGELLLELQSKLLRVLEDGSFERLGSTKSLHVNVRIIAATNRDIAQNVKEEKFRKDLYYRLNVFPISIPPLRERPEDIPLMVTAFVTNLQKRMGKEIKSIPKKTMESLKSYSWPGNVRELKNVIEHAMILSKDNTLVVHLPDSGLSERDATQDLYGMERLHVVSVLEKTGWRVSGKGGAAEALGLKRTTLEAKMKKLGIKRPNK